MTPSILRIIFFSQLAFSVLQRQHPRGHLRFPHAVHVVAHFFPWRESIRGTFRKRCAFFCCCLCFCSLFVAVRRIVIIGGSDTRAAVSLGLFIVSVSQESPPAYAQASSSAAALLRSGTLILNVH